MASHVGKSGRNKTEIGLQFNLTPSHSWKMMNISSMFTVDISCVNSRIIYYILIHPNFLAGFQLFVHLSQKSHFITLVPFVLCSFYFFSLMPFLVFNAVAFFPTKLQDLLAALGSRLKITAAGCNDVFSCVMHSICLPPVHIYFECCPSLLWVLFWTLPSVLLVTWGVLH